ncbi:hypothetical protein P8452_12967 [Trifolium repens]|nr:hypothetical protein P8452_12967 [Trifolium repens]
MEKSNESLSGQEINVASSDFKEEQRAKEVRDMVFEVAEVYGVTAGTDIHLLDRSRFATLIAVAQKIKCDTNSKSVNHVVSTIKDVNQYLELVESHHVWTSNSDCTRYVKEIWAKRVYVCSQLLFSAAPPKVIEELSYVVLLRKRFSYIKSIPRCFFHILHLLHTTVVYYSHDQLVEIIKHFVVPR